MRIPKALIVVCALTVGVVAGACSGGTSAQPTKSPTTDKESPTAVTAKPTTVAAPAGTKVGVVENHLAVVPDTLSAKAGTITFVVHNDGVARHDFHVLKTDLPAGKLPVQTSEAVVSATGIEAIGQLSAIEAGSSQSLTVDLTAGNYVLICNLPEHYEEGMYVGFAVN